MLKLTRLLSTLGFPNLLKTQNPHTIEQPKHDPSNFNTENKPIADVLEIVKKAGAGDFEARIINISSDDENAELFHSINDLIDRFDAYVRESVACLEHVNNNRFYRKIVETGMQGSFLTASKSANSALNFMQEKQENFTKVANDFEHTVGSFVSAVASASTKLSASSQGMQQIASKSNTRASQVTEAAGNTSSDLHTMASAVEQLTVSAEAIDQDIVSAAKAAKDATIEINAAEKSVSSLGEVVEHIENALEMIHQVSFQTKMLAMNAKIEASRAGHAGKGFAVVAEEIKSLSDRSSQVTSQVDNHLLEIKDAMQETVNDMTKVMKRVTDISKANASISIAMNEQVSATNEISQKIDQASNATKGVSRNIEDVRTATEETGNSARQVNAAALDLSSRADTLTNVVDEFLYSARKAAA